MKVMEEGEEAEEVVTEAEEVVTEAEEVVTEAEVGTEEVTEAGTEVAGMVAGEVREDTRSVTLYGAGRTGTKIHCSTGRPLPLVTMAVATGMNAKKTVAVNGLPATNIFPVVQNNVSNTVLVWQAGRNLTNAPNNSV
jgi:hypothetical protein